MSFKKITSKKIVFKTPWFYIQKKKYQNKESPYFSLHTKDYVSIVAINKKNKIVLVKQFRPAIDNFTIELPSGHVELNETPEESAEKELFEETGYIAGKLEFLGQLIPDSGRLSNKLWCYFTKDVYLNNNSTPEVGIEVKEVSLPELNTLIKKEKFNHALHLAIIGLCIIKGKLKI